MKGLTGLREVVDVVIGVDTPCPYRLRPLTCRPANPTTLSVRGLSPSELLDADPSA
jgi:hypothetical protein